MNKPFWVEIGMLGIKSRGAALAWFYSSLAGSVLFAAMTFGAVTTILESSVALGITVGVLSGVLFALSSIWYRLCIKWMDDNGGWLK